MTISPVYISHIFLALNLIGLKVYFYNGGGSRSSAVCNTEIESLLLAKNIFPSIETILLPVFNNFVSILAGPTDIGR